MEKTISFVVSSNKDQEAQPPAPPTPPHPTPPHPSAVRTPIRLAVRVAIRLTTHRKAPLRCIQGFHSRTIHKR